MKYNLSLESDNPPEIFVGQNLAGGKVVKIEAEEKKTVSASELACIYNYSAETIRKKLAGLNIGSAGKFQYPTREAHAILSGIRAHKTGRKRKNTLI